MSTFNFTEQTSNSLSDQVTQLTRELENMRLTLQNQQALLVERNARIAALEGRMEAMMEPSDYNKLVVNLYFTFKLLVVIYFRY